MVLAACGPAYVFHKDPEPACGDGENLVLASREDVARLSGCTRAGAIHIRPAGPLELGSLLRLETLESLRVGPSVGFEELALPRLREIRGTLRIVGNGNLRAVKLPALVRAGRIEIEGNVALGNLSMPKLAATDALIVNGNADLGLIDIAALARVDELVITDNPRLVMIEAGQLVPGSARIDNNAMLPPDVTERLRELR